MGADVRGPLDVEGPAEEGAGARIGQDDAVGLEFGLEVALELEVGAALDRRRVAGHDLERALGLGAHGADGGDQDGERGVELARGHGPQLEVDVGARADLDDLQVVELAVGVEVDAVGRGAAGALRNSSSSAAVLISPFASRSTTPLEVEVREA